MIGAGIGFVHLQHIDCTAILPLPWHSCFKNLHFCGVHLFCIRRSCANRTEECAGSSRDQDLQDPMAVLPNWGMRDKYPEHTRKKSDITVAIIVNDIFNSW